MKKRDRTGIYRIFGGSSRTASAAFALLIPILLTGCNSQPAKPAESAKPEPKAPELLTGRSAFYKAYIAARGWAADAKPFRIESTATSEGNGQDGKWAIWRIEFASASQRAAKPYTWSGSNASDAPSRGISPGTEDNYNPSNASTQTFDAAFLKIDSDEAFATAQKHGGDKLLQEDPKTIVNYVCDWNHNTNQLVWHVSYGANRETAKLTVAVNASTGEFIRAEK
ncbi:MAG TPA: hypothetical protein VMU61_02415 [Candidatus Aquilonibacter sp.]|nr:hypothetical protein [Candidatus Aquilonibacter sp.]